MASPLLVALVGPTAVGKTSVAIQLATYFKTEILSADSRQLYRELPIGTAIPSIEEQAGIPHHFLGDRSIVEPLDAGAYAREALIRITGLFQQHPILILAGGSGLYIDAVLHGFDDLPEANPKLREALQLKLKTEGIIALQQELQRLDPDYYTQVDLNNPSRLMRAIEVCLESGKPYSQLRNKRLNAAPFRVVKIGLQLPREELYARINRRTELMFEAGFEAEARAVYPYRHLQALQTVGYRELFDYFDGKTDFKTAMQLIQQHTRNYAKRQVTWWRKDGAINWFAPTEIERIISYILTAQGD